MKAKQMIELVCRAYGYEEAYVLGNCRKQELVDFRIILAKNLKHFYPEMTLERIGAYIGNRHHTTIIHMLRNYENWYLTHRMFRQTANNCKKLIERNFETKTYCCAAEPNFKLIDAIKINLNK